MRSFAILTKKRQFGTLRAMILKSNSLKYITWNFLIFTKPNVLEMKLDCTAIKRFYATKNCFSQQNVYKHILLRTRYIFFNLQIIQSHLHIYEIQLVI